MRNFITHKKNRNHSSKTSDYNCDNEKDSDTDNNENNSAKIYTIR